MQQLLKQSYIPFGSQYYRAPSPHAEDWERDLKNMAALGFNMVKFWVQWRWNHPAEDEFYFDDIDQLMEIAHKNKLKVMLNTVFDVAPAWIYRKYSDASMITLDGRKIAPQTQPHRQIGGLGYCFNHDGVMENFFRFLRETVKRYTGHPALAIWNVGSEPELTSSMAELRLYADSAEKMGDMLCYCPHCEAKFKLWLSQKYNSIDQLNQGWNRNYRSFDEIELPKTRNTFNDIIDWRMFFVHTMGENVKRRFDVARGIDNGKHPLMCHHVFIQGFPIASTANDPWNVGEYGDLHGFTQMDDPMMIDVLRFCAKDRPVISEEMLMLPGYTLDLPRTIDANDVKRFVFSGVAGNLKGFIFWQYPPEILGRETPTWGLSFLDGSETPWLKAFAETGYVLQKNASFLLDAKSQKAEIALLYHPENQIFSWAATGNEKNVTDSLLGTHRALYEHNFIIDFIHPKEFENNILKNYKVVYIPFPYVLGKKICQALEAWVKYGGVLIGESYFAGWNLEQGHHEKIVPGYGLHKVFQARQAVVDPADANGEAEIIIERDLPFIQKGEMVKGALVKETFFLESADVLARFSTGEPAITLAGYGKGKAILIGSYIGLPFHRKKYVTNGELIASLVEMTCKIERPIVIGDLKVRVDLLTDPAGQIMMILQNLEQRNIEVSITVPLNNIDSLTEQFSGEALMMSSLQDRSITTVALAPKEVKIYCGR
jgi:beta-galactosidase